MLDEFTKKLQEQCGPQLRDYYLSKIREFNTKVTARQEELLLEQTKKVKEEEEKARREQQRQKRIQAFQGNYSALAVFKNQT